MVGKALAATEVVMEAMEATAIMEEMGAMGAIAQDPVVHLEKEEEEVKAGEEEMVTGGKMANVYNSIHIF
jgi:hypothetical protein